jgi:hypothetical protein
MMITRIEETTTSWYDRQREIATKRWLFIEFYDYTTFFYSAGHFYRALRSPILCVLSSSPEPSCPYLPALTIVHCDGTSILSLHTI